MLNKISTYIEKHNLLCAGDTIIVGLSGGADSVALLHILVQLNYSCIAAHCNFHLRGDEALLKDTKRNSTMYATTGNLIIYRKKLSFRDLK